MTPLERTKTKIERSADKATRWIGSTNSIVVHTVLFVAIFILPLFGFDFDRVLLILTTALSFEAIYLAIFIQMTVNKNTEDIEEIQKDVEEIQEDVDEIQEDIEDISEEEAEANKNLAKPKEYPVIDHIQKTLLQLQKEIESLKK